MDTLTNEEIADLENKVQYISHGASLSIKMPDGSLFNSKWEMSIENDGITSHDKLVSFLRLQVYNRINYDLQKDYIKYARLVNDTKTIK